MSQAAGFFTNSGPGGFIQTLTGNSGGAVPPTAGNINVVGTGVITVVGNPGTSTLTITPSGAIASSFVTSPATGTATPVAGVLTFAGAGTVSVSAAGSTVTITGVAGGVTSITGNTGPAQTGAINLITANSTPLFAGAAGTITLDFALTDNLLLGSTGGSITTGNTNVGYGKLAAASISSGASNCFLGYESGVIYTTGSNSTAVGAFSMFKAVAGASNNTAIGYSSLYNLAGAGTNNTCLGLNSATAFTTTESNNIIIGSTGVIADNNRIRIGTNGTHNSCFITGIDGVNVGSVAKVVTMASDQLGTSTITAGTGISVTPGANTITIATTGATNPVTTLHTQDGNDVTATAGVINISGGNSLTTTGTAGPNTVTISLSGITQYNVQTGGAANALNNVAPSATSGVPLISQGAASQPIFGTAVVAGGGTGAVSFTAHGVLLGEGTSPIGVTAVGTTGQVLTGVTGADPVWASPAASSISITGDSGGALTGNAFTFTGGTTGLTFSGAGTTETLTGTLVVSNGGTGRATLTNHGLLVGAGTTAITQLAAASNGQLPIGSTGADPVLATLSAGTGISISNGAGTITISGSGGGLTWSVITANQTAVVNNGYFCNKAGTLALALPATSSVGDVIEVANENTALGVQFTQAAGQQILIGNTNTTLGATGTLTSSAVGDTLKIVCKVANTIWRVTSIVGNWTPA